MKNQAAAEATREFVYSIEVPNADESGMLGRLRDAFPELVWREGEGNLGKISLAGESAETPPKTGIFLLCKEPPGPFKLTIRLRHAGLIKAEELRLKFMEALPGASVSKDSFPFLTDEDSVPWVNPPPSGRKTPPELPPVKKSGGDPISVKLKTPVDRPVVAIFKFGVEILISRALLEAMVARLDEIKTPANEVEGDERLEMMRGGRARKILSVAVPSGDDGNSQVPLAALPSDSLFLLGLLLEHGLAEVVHFNRHGQALSAKQISVRHFGGSAGPTAGFGMVTFAIGNFGPEIFGMNRWVS